MKEKQSAHKKILVVGTTSDYIDWIQKTCPGKALFLTSPSVRKDAAEDSPSEEDEVLASLDNFDGAKTILTGHTQKWNQKIAGVTCFDCESLELASRIAGHLGLEYHSLEAVQNCRDKYISKTLWQANNIPCPETLPVNFESEAVEFLSKHPDGIVLKPFYGSGSELVFKCQTPKDCKNAFKTISAGLKERQSNPIFKKSSSNKDLMLAEKFIAGTEYSCDFIIEANTIKIIRLTRKIKHAEQLFGTISGYVLISGMPSRVDVSSLKNCLLNGASVLGIQKGICMADFVLDDNHPVLVEITPRPGGDCIPFLLLEAGKIDIIKLSLDLAEQKPLKFNKPITYKPLVGLRIHARKSGKLKEIDTSNLENEIRIKKIHLIRKPGHIITMPPEDYDSWLLGHIIIAPNENSYPETQCLLIRNRLRVEID